MAFSRRFKKETWYLRLPSGEIEVVTADALQRAFECGLVDARTSVRAFGSHSWITLLEAAGLEVPTAPSLVSLSPMAFDAPAADLSEGAVWQSRNDVDPQAFKPSRAPAVVALLVSAALTVTAFIGAKAPTSATLRHVAAASELAAPAPAPTVKPSAPPMSEMLHPTKFEKERFTKRQQWRLQELDWVTRTRGRNLPRQRQATVTADPFTHSGKTRIPGDPLDGSL